MPTHYKPVEARKMKNKKEKFPGAHGPECDVCILGWTHYEGEHDNQCLCSGCGERYQLAKVKRSQYNDFARGKTGAQLIIRVILESPYAGDIHYNLQYARAAMRDCLKRGEAPFASHALYTQPGVLDDDNPEDRALGMRAGRNWYEFAHYIVAYTDLGISKGMQEGIAHAERLRLTVYYRKLASLPKRESEVLDFWGHKVKVYTGD